MKKIFIFILFLLFLVPVFSSAQENKAELYFFYSPTCPHCARESKFLSGLKKKYSEIEIKRFAVSKKENIDLLKDFYKKYNVSSQAYGRVPITFIGGEYFTGFNEEIAQKIESRILSDAKNEKKSAFSAGKRAFSASSKKILKLPFIGEINVAKYSLPVLAVILGILDGFNVCSLGALILILGLVLALKSRKRILVFGGVFIVTTAVVYGILIIIWYQIFSFLIPYAKIMEILIGLLGIGGGFYFLKEFIRLKKKGPLCQAEEKEGITSKFSSKFQGSFKKHSNVAILIGLVFLFAGIITIVEFPCSAAVPVVFAGILAQSGLSVFSYLFYIIVYLVFYMLDEIIVFLAALFTLNLWFSSRKIVVWIALVEAVVLFALGFYYLFGFAVFI